MRACRACRPRCAASTATASCAGARLPLEPRHASICNHHVLIVSLCLIRRGLALIIESDFYATDAGRAHFADQLTSIRLAWCGPCASHPTAWLTHARPPCLAGTACNGERPRRDVCVFAPPSTTLRCPRSPPRPLPHAQTCNFDVLYAYLTSANYDFSCAKTAARTLLPCPPLSHPLTAASRTRPQTTARRTCARSATSAPR